MNLQEKIDQRDLMITRQHAIINSLESKVSSREAEINVMRELIQKHEENQKHLLGQLELLNALQEK
jgi:hypothetical protein